MITAAMLLVPVLGDAGNGHDPEFTLPTNGHLVVIAIVSAAPYFFMGGGGGMDVRSFFKPIPPTAAVAALGSAATTATATDTDADADADTDADTTATAAVTKADADADADTDAATTATAAATAAASSSSAGPTAPVVVPGASEARPGMLDGETMQRVGRTPRSRIYPSNPVQWLLTTDSESDDCDRSDPEPRAQLLNNVGSPSPRNPAPPASAPVGDLCNPAAPVINLNLSGTIAGGVHISVTTHTTVTVNGVDTAVESRWRSGSAQGSLQPGKTHVFTPSQPGDMTSIGETKKTAFDMMKSRHSSRPRCCMPTKPNPVPSSWCHVVDAGCAVL